MEGKPRCKKCGRILKSPASITRGMGSVCAGLSDGKGKRDLARTQCVEGKTYLESGPSRKQTRLFPGEVSIKPLSKKEVYRKQREERRRAFETHSRFQCGVAMPKNQPLIYEPLTDGEWKEYPTGRVISHKRLQGYLTRYQLI